MAEQTEKVRLSRLPWGDYRFDHNGAGYRVVRHADGAAPSVVIWEVQRESDRAEMAHYTTLTDLRRRVLERLDRSEEESDA